MRLEQYITKLLFKYDCVVVPNFGGFLCNEIGCKFDPINYKFYPPTKKATFNVNLNNNDGLLAKYISKKEGISYQEAMLFIKQSVKEWNLSLLSEKEINLSSLGKLTMQKSNRLEFNPDENFNFSINSFGLTSLKAKYIAKKDIKLESKYYINWNNVAAVFLIFSIGGLIFSLENPKSTIQNSMGSILGDIENLIKPSKSVNTAIINAPTIDSTITVDKEIYYDIIIGAFQEKPNASNLVLNLQDSGFANASLVETDYGFYLVSIEKAESEKNAFEKISSSILKDYPNAWPRKK